MTRSKLLAIVTGAISILLAIAYLLLVQLLDFRGEMLPAPVSDRPAAPTEALALAGRAGEGSAWSQLASLT